MGPLVQLFVCIYSPATCQPTLFTNLFSCLSYIISALRASCLIPWSLCLFDLLLDWIIYHSFFFNKSSFNFRKPIIDNITDAIYGSRKTICVISHKYLESEWCSREIQAASFRLLDEQKDILILVFLDDIPSYLLSPYHRMRKMLKKKTYLSWPRAAENTELFWEKLRQALETSENPEAELLLLTVSNTP
ncbi:toll-like receptor 13 [Oreochromis niloticus]|uniref:toll-like receptor 13 n=1 Tax=Oreochromis niloticus TaxID=8128 RepID=UPI000DF1B994|nr:toll-like receptor 13 [Oreochromis niloticus]